jgi:hypothetical protein
MSTELTTKTTLPTVAELFADNLEQAFKHEQLNLLLNQEPKKEWVKEHPYIKGYKYLPIDKVEFMLRKIFKEFSIEVLREGHSFNGVYVVVRVHYKDPTTGTMRFHDGIGAMQLQTAKGTSPADLININNGALSMAYPAAKTVAIKDACDHFGKLFGCDLNRKDTMNFTFDVALSSPEIKKAAEETRRITTHLTNMRAKGVDDIDVILIEIPTEHHQQAREIWSKL